MDEELFQGQLSINDPQQAKIQDNKENENDQLVFIQDRSLNLHKYIKMVLISNDEKYLATLGCWRIIRIYYLKSKKLIKIMKLDNEYKCIVIMKFSNNSRNLLFGDTKGFLGCYDINNNCKLIYNHMVHSKGVDNILQIDDDQILTSSYDRSFIITNIKYNQQSLKIQNAHDDWIAGIEFDKSKNFIISCSYDWSIKFFNRIDGKLKIEQQNAHQTLTVVSMIQLIQKDNHLLSTNNQQLILWQIDYLNLQLINLTEYNNIIYNFTSVFNNNKIIVISDKLIQILDKELIVVQSINHNLKQIKELNKTRQLNFLNYVLIQTQDTFLVLKKVRKLKN